MLLSDVQSRRKSSTLYMSGSVRVVSLLATPVSMHSMMLVSSHVRPAAHWDPVMVPGCKTRRPLMPGLARPQTACASISRSMSDKMRYSFRIRGRLSPSQKAEEVCRQTQCVASQLLAQWLWLKCHQPPTSRAEPGGNKAIHARRIVGLPYAQHSTLESS